MSTKDTQNNAKDALLNELQSIKGLLDEDDDIPVLSDDDDIPVLGDEEEDIPTLDGDDFDIPVLGDADDDIPVLGDEEDTPMLGTSTEETSMTDSSLQAALSELESLQLSPKASKTRAANESTAEVEIEPEAEPLPEPEPAPEPAKANESASADTAEEEAPSPSDKMRAIAQRISAARSKAGKKTAESTHMEQEEYQPELSLNSTAKPGDSILAKIQSNADEQQQEAKVIPEPVYSEDPTTIRNQAIQLPEDDEEEDGSAELLKMLEDDPKPIPNARTPEQMTPSTQLPLSEEEIDRIVDEVAEEYMVVLEAALKKKLKSKISDLV